MPPPPPSAAPEEPRLVRASEALLSWVRGLPTAGKVAAWLFLFPLLVGASAIAADVSDSGRAIGVGAGVLALLAGFALVGGGAEGTAEQEISAQRAADIEAPTFSATETVTVEASPDPAETVTVEASPEPAETVTVEASPEPAETVTVEAEPEPAETVTVVETEVVEIEPQQLVEEPDSSVYYENCDAVRAANADPVRRGEPGYASHLDRDGDGVGCE